MTTLVWTILGFASGSLMFSYWLGRLALKRDIRAVGDGNPGATNVLLAGGKAWGLLALLLDVLKGALPVSLARYAFGVSGWALLPVSLAPIFGHAFSPWLKGRGGKAVAVSFGVWIALTLWEAPTLGGLLLGLWFALLSVSGWAVLLSLICLIAYYLLTNPDPVLLAVLAVNLALLAYKYRADLGQFPLPREWVTKRLWRPS